MNHLAKLTLQFLSVAASLLLASYAGAAPPLPGAIFTTDADGVIVNGNTKYGSKCGLTGVWLDGGPGPNAPPTAAGLPGGDYYFQVTDPSGKKLLSTDPQMDRCVTVNNSGIITGNCPSGTHVERPSADAGSGNVIELCPFDDTPNPGGVYKAWITPVGDGTVTGGGFVGDPTMVDNDCGRGCFHGFVPARSKTDNFKVSDTRTFCIAVRKEILDEKKGIEPGVGWEIVVVDSLGVSTVLTTQMDPNAGNAEICGLLPGFYTVEETLQDGFIVLDTQVNGQSVGAQLSIQLQIKKGMKTDSAFVRFLNAPCSEKGCKK